MNSNKTFNMYYPDVNSSDIRRITVPLSRLECWVFDDDSMFDMSFDTDQPMIHVKLGSEAEPYTTGRYPVEIKYHQSGVRKLNHVSLNCGVPGVKNLIFKIDGVDNVLNHGLGDLISYYFVKHFPNILEGSYDPNLGLNVFEFLDFRISDEGIAKDVIGEMQILLKVVLPDKHKLSHNHNASLTSFDYFNLLRSYRTKDMSFDDDELYEDLMVEDNVDLLGDSDDESFELDGSDFEFIDDDE